MISSCQRLDVVLVQHFTCCNHYDGNVVIVKHSIKRGRWQICLYKTQDVHLIWYKQKIFQDEQETTILQLHMLLLQQQRQQHAQNNCKENHNGVQSNLIWPSEDNLNEKTQKSKTISAKIIDCASVQIQALHFFTRCSSGIIYAVSCVFILSTSSQENIFLVFRYHVSFYVLPSLYFHIQTFQFFNPDEICFVSDDVLGCCLNCA